MTKIIVHCDQNNSFAWLTEISAWFSGFPSIKENICFFHLVSLPSSLGNMGILNWLKKNIYNVIYVTISILCVGTLKFQPYCQFLYFWRHKTYVYNIYNRIILTLCRWWLRKSGKSRVYQQFSFEVDGDYFFIIHSLLLFYPPLLVANHTTLLLSGNYLRALSILPAVVFFIFSCFPHRRLFTCALSCVHHFPGCFVPCLVCRLGVTGSHLPPVLYHFLCALLPSLHLWQAFTLPCCSHWGAHPDCYQVRRTGCSHTAVHCWPRGSHPQWPNGIALTPGWCGALLHTDGLCVLTVLSLGSCVLFCLILCACVCMCFRATVVISRCHMAYFPLTLDLKAAEMSHLSCVCLSVKNSTQHDACVPGQCLCRCLALNSSVLFSFFPSLSAPSGPVATCCLDMASCTAPRKRAAMPEITSDGKLLIMHGWEDCIPLNVRQFNASFIYLHRCVFHSVNH